MTFLMAFVALIVSGGAAIFAHRQAKAAEAANRLNRSANRRAARAERRAVAAANAMAWRWQVTANGGDAYLISNVGMNSAFGVEVVLADHMDGRELYAQAMSPLEQYEFKARVSTAYPVDMELPRMVTVKWYASAAHDGTQWTHTFALPQQTTQEAARPNA